MSFKDARGTKSLIFGYLFSVRLPSLKLPIWVNDPIGLASSFLIASTPAIKVVATAPKPGIKMPSLPSAGRISSFIFNSLLVKK